MLQDIYENMKNIKIKKFITYVLLLRKTLHFYTNNGVSQNSKNREIVLYFWYDLGS